MPTYSPPDYVVEQPFPTECEDTGRVLIGWRGPCWGQFQQITAFRVLSQYLTESSVAPLQQALVEIAEPFCGAIDWQLECFSTALHVLVLEDVFVDKLHSIREAVFDVLRGIIRDGVDMSRIATIVNRERRQLRHEIETKPDQFFAQAFIAHFMYGPRAAGAEPLANEYV